MAEEKGYSQTVSTAELSGTPRLVLEQPTGDVFVEAWDRPEIEVSVSDDDATFEIEVEEQAVVVHRARPPRARDAWEDAKREFSDLGIGLDKVASRVERSVERSMRKMKRGMGGFSIDFGRWAGGQDYRIKVPFSCDLRLRTSSGDLRVAGVNGTHYLQTTSGDVRIDEVHGNLLVSSASGDISLRKVEGKLAARTASGDIEADESALQEISVSTASGDLDLDLVSVPDREFEIKGVSGDVQLTFPAGSALTLEIDTLSGEVVCEPRYEVVRERRGPQRHRTATINGGGLRGHIATVSGDVLVTVPRGDITRPEGEVAGQPTMNLGGESRRRSDEAGEVRRKAEVEILQSLEKGELTVEEAMRRLNDL